MEQKLIGYNLETWTLLKKKKRKKEKEKWRATLIGGWSIGRTMTFNQVDSAESSECCISIQNMVDVS